MNRRRIFIAWSKSLSISLLLLLCAPGISVANDARSKAILDRVNVFIHKTPSFSASFSYKALNRQGRTSGTGSGTFTMSGDRYNVNTSGEQIICDGHTVWTVLKSNREVHISNYNPATATLSPSNLFSGNFERDYTYSYGGKKTFAGKKTDVIRLTPRANKPFRTLTLYIDAGGTIRGGTITDKGGNTFTYTIGTISTRDAASNTHYVYNARAYKDYEIIDLR